VAHEPGESAHSALCLRLMQLFPRISKGMRRYQDRAAPQTPTPLTPAQDALIRQWLDGAANPLARVLDKLAPSEQQAFLKAMNMLEDELHTPEPDR